MGGRSSSSSSASTTTNTNDNRVAVEEGGIGVGAGATVSFVDGGIVNAAKDIVESFAGVVGGVTTFAQNTIRDNNAILAERTEDDTKEVAESTVRNVLLATVGVAAILGWAMIRRK